jgi:hypothetical protein
MGAKNKVRKISFTELYLINKKTLNLLKKKKKEISDQVRSFPLSSNTPPIYQTHHHYANPQVDSGRNFIQDGITDHTSTNNSVNSSNENRTPSSNAGGDDEYFDDEISEILLDSDELYDRGDDNNINPVNEDLVITPHINNSDSHLQNVSNIIIENIPREDMNRESENSQIPQQEIHNFNDAQKKNINYLNQAKRGSYLNRKRGNIGDVNVIKSVLRGEIKKMQAKSREQKSNSFREKPVKNIKPPIVIQSPDSNITLRVSPPETSSLTPSTGNNSNIEVSAIPLISTRPAIPLANVNNNSNNNNNIAIPRVNSVYDNSLHISRGIGVTRKRANPSNVIVRNNPRSQVENMDVEPPSNSNNNNNNNNTRANHNQSDPDVKERFPQQKKIHKKSKVIIIEPTESEKSKNSEFVDKILQSNVNDPYDVFQFSKTARITYAGLKRKFNSFSKKLHPDKEPSPGAHEAFIIMRRAFIQLKKEIQIRDELEKEKTQTKKKQSPPQTGFGIKKWMKLCK